MQCAQYSTCCCSVARSCPTLFDPLDCSTPGFPVFHRSQSLLKLMSIESLMTSTTLILCHPLLSCLQSFPASGSFPMSWLFTSDGHKYWSFSFSTSASNEYLGLISFRIDWFYLLAVQRTLKSLIQHHGFKASVCWHSAFFMVQLSHLYMAIGKTIALTIGTFVGKIMSLLFNMLSRFIIAFLPRSKCLLGILYLISHLTDPSRRK